MQSALCRLVGEGTDHLVKTRPEQVGRWRHRPPVYDQVKDRLEGVGALPVILGCRGETQE